MNRFFITHIVGFLLFFSATQASDALVTEAVNPYEDILHDELVAFLPIAQEARKHIVDSPILDNRQKAQALMGLWQKVETCRERALYFDQSGCLAWRFKGLKVRIERDRANYLESSPFGRLIYLNAALAELFD